MYLDELIIPASCFCSYLCAHSDHKQKFSQYSNALVNNILVQIVENYIPRKKFGIEKHFWSNELKQLKQFFVQAYVASKNIGRPRFGLLNDHRLLCKNRYIKALKAARCCIGGKYK